jgi:hypothetical protein
VAATTFISLNGRKYVIEGRNCKYNVLFYFILLFSNYTLLNFIFWHSTAAIHWEWPPRAFQWIFTLTIFQEVVTKNEGQCVLLPMMDHDVCSTYHQAVDLDEWKLNWGLKSALQRNNPSHS